MQKVSEQVNIVYHNEKKDLPLQQLHELFIAVGWSDGGVLPEEMKAGFIKPWLHSTLVISAWDGDHLVGAVRVLSDAIFRSVIYDLLVAPEYQGKGIGSELVNRCKNHYPGSEWLVGCDRKNVAFYKKLGFLNSSKSDAFLVIPCKLF
ncbi:MAG: GNAT family N-acetyltransferase [Eubacteriales bacterium]|nr:GNAT family N-acetyltransferase [Eubacteriales bacterium]